MAQISSAEMLAHRLSSPAPALPVTPHRITKVPMIVRDARTTSRKTRTSQPVSAGSALRERRAKDSGVESASIPPSQLIGIALMGAIRVAVPGLRQGHFDAIPLPQPCVTGMRAACRKLARISIFPAFRAFCRSSGTFRAPDAYAFPCRTRGKLPCVNFLQLLENPRSSATMRE